MSSITEQAIAAIGEASGDDWVLQPQQHAKALPPEARLLRQVLEDAALQSIIRTYEKFDEEANRAQRFYKLQVKGAAIASFLAIIASFLAIVVLPGYHLIPAERVNALYLAQAALAFLAAALWVASNKGASFRRWIGSRAWAEDARMNLFKAVLNAKEELGRSGKELPLLPLQLEYFRRYLLDSQRKYYHLRGEYFVRARSGSKRLAAALFALSLLPIVWEMQGHAQWPAWLDSLIGALPSKTLVGDIFLGIAVFVVGLEVVRLAYAAISLNYRNAWRYPKTGEKLDALSREPLEEARVNALKNDQAAVIRFADKVQQELLAEHREWIAISQGPGKPIRLPA